MWNISIFTGRAVKDAELKSVGSSQVCTFTLAHNKRIKKRDGEYHEKTCFIDCEVWNNSADYASKYVKKGRVVNVQAELEQDEWTSAEGQKRKKHKFYINRVNVERSKDDSQSSDSTSTASVGISDESLPF